MMTFDPDAATINSQRGLNMSHQIVQMEGSQLAFSFKKESTLSFRKTEPDSITVLSFDHKIGS
jgi:hypothetical protein